MACLPRPAAACRGLPRAASKLGTFSEPLGATVVLLCDVLTSNVYFTKPVNQPHRG